MQNDVGKIVGVSPAFFVSSYGKGFTSRQVCRDIPWLRVNGFGSIQLEIFLSDCIDDWKNGGMKRVLEVVASEGISVSVFVAHYLGNSFTSAAELKRALNQDGFNEVLDLVNGLDISVPIAVPMLPWSGGGGWPVDKVSELLEKWADMAGERGRRLVLEIVPGSLTQSYDNFLSAPVWNKVSSKVDLLFDTGHAHVKGSCFKRFLAEHGHRVKILHLSDNDGKINLSLPPGEGTIEWSQVIDGLDRSGYEGSWDLEIAVESGSVKECYKHGRKQLLRHLASRQQ